MNATKLANEFQNRKDWKLINYIHWSEQSETMLSQQQEKLTKYELRHEEQRKRIDELEAQIKTIMEANTRSRP